MSKAQDYIDAANSANYYDAGNILARAIGDKKLVTKLEKQGYITLSLKLIEAVAFRYETSNQKFMKQILQQFAS